MSYLYQWWDIIVFLLFAVFHVGGWLEIRSKLITDPLNCRDEREFAASALNNASVAGVTAVSILIPASLLMIQLGAERTGFPSRALEDVFRASLWFLLSLAFGLFLLFLIPMRSQKYNVVRDLLTGIPFGPQLAALLIGMIWLVAGIYTAVYS
ncbi:hypothetical protein [Vreelandella titanicae]|uniref:DUF2269 family protein n=1 Tax=Vreelandella titanicae TaxID=664683 RepID=A0A558JBR1_9GAMM|nr:hypothetical protein [Halomonas titanicae]TVU91024.1 hypothetical protein FQP89_08060 [Halomonas titanicae]